jgi:hypothetical protein
MQANGHKSLKELIADDYKKCAVDPIYFMKKYCKIQHPVRGKIPFHLYPFQEDTLTAFNNNRYNIVLKSRQTGISTLVAGFSLWKMLFNTDFNVLVIATKQEVAKNLVTKVRVMHELLPSWLRSPTAEDNRLSLRLANGSQIKAIASSPDAGRSEALSLLVFDEAAFIESAEEIWLSAQSTLSTGGSAILLSTPNGVGNFFHKMWMDAENDVNGFNTVKLHWSVHPERDIRWRDEQTRLLGTKGAAQECVGYDEFVYVKGENDVETKIKIGELYELLNSVETNHTEFVENKRYKILTPDGYKSFDGITKRTKNEYLTLHLSNGEIIDCSLNHTFISNGCEILASDLDFFDEIDAMGGRRVSVNDIEYKNSEIELYDIISVDDNNLFIVDDIVSHNCDVSFVSSGDNVIDPDILMFYKETHIEEPREKRGIDGNLWVWEYPNTSDTYIVCADVSRGDASDYSTAQVIDIVNLTQVAEYKGKIDTKDFGNFLVSLATEYNDALLVIENSNVGWATLQQCIDRNYGNLFYMSKDLRYVDTQRQMSNKINAAERQLVAGFSTTTRTRPLIISKLDEYLSSKSIIIKSNRLIDELFVFIWKNSKAQAMQGYNDDLVMSFAISLWVRDTAIRLRQEGVNITQKALDGISASYLQFYNPNNVVDDPYKIQVGDNEEDIRWLF